MSRVVWSTSEYKSKILPAIEESLCQYGLTNDNANLEPGFVFERCFFNGNPVNNEIRFYQSVAVRDYLTSVIVAAGKAESYRQAYQKALKGACPHWQYTCGIDYRRLFVDAVASNDKGFRVTWLMQLLKRSHPLLLRLLLRAQSENTQGTLYRLADKISLMAKKKGRKFFLTPYFKHSEALENRRSRLWTDYLEAYRNGETDRAARLLQHYRKFCNYLEKVCE